MVGCHVLISLVVHDKNLCVNWVGIWPEQGLPGITGHHAAFWQIGTCLHTESSTEAPYLATAETTALQAKEMQLQDVHFTCTTDCS